LRQNNAAFMLLLQSTPLPKKLHAQERVIRGAEKQEARAMSEMPCRGPIALVALVALAFAGAAARADDAPPAPPPFASPADAPAHAAATAPRIYVPLHPAEPREVEEELAPLPPSAFTHPGDDGAAGNGAGAAPDARSAPAPGGR
jgi:hypothetical protein